MNKEQKILYFQYTLHKLLLWYRDVNGSEENNDLSILKSLKLLFFVSAAKTTKNDENSLVDRVFHSYVAMPYGHVEEDIYSEIKTRNGDLDYFTINNQNTLRKGQDITGLLSQLNPTYRTKIDESIEYLISQNKNLISLAPFDLVELSHLWFSWRKNYEIAISNGLRKMEIPLEDIKSETKVFNLQPFC